MAVRAQQLEIGQAIVIPISIDVMERHAQRLFPPFRQSAPPAAIGLQPLV
jgi:hypothetical protein